MKLKQIGVSLFDKYFSENESNSNPLVTLAFIVFIVISIGLVQNNINIVRLGYYMFMLTVFLEILVVFIANYSKNRCHGTGDIESDKLYDINDESSDDMAKKKNQTELGLKIFYTFLAVYGFLAFLNPLEFPLTRLLLENTSYYLISEYDRAFGILLLVIGLYLLQEK